MITICYPEYDKEVESWESQLREMVVAYRLQTSPELKEPGQSDRRYRCDCRLPEKTAAGCGRLACAGLWGLNSSDFGLFIRHTGSGGDYGIAA